MLFASRATTQMRPLRRNPDGTGLSGRSAVSRRSPMGPTIGFASLRASHPGKPPSRPRGAYAEVPLWHTGALQLQPGSPVEFVTPYEIFVGLRYTRARRGAGRNRFVSFIAFTSMAGIAL